MASDLGKGKASYERMKRLFERRTHLLANTRHLRRGLPSCGIPWIAILGNDSVCVVSSSKYADNKDDLRNFLTDVLTAEIVNPLSGEKLVGVASNTSIDKAAVVSMSGYALEEESDNEALSAHLGEQVAINFLGNELKRYPTFTYEVTIQTAVSALCYLLRDNLMAHEIEVASIKDIGSGLPLPLPLLLPEKEIEEVLTSIRRDTFEIKIYRRTNHDAGKDKDKRKYKNKRKDPPL